MMGYIGEHVFNALESCFGIVSNVNTKCGDLVLQGTGGEDFFHPGLIRFTDVVFLKSLSSLCKDCKQNVNI